MIELYRAGRYADAIPLAERAFAVFERLLGGGDRRVAKSLNNLALLYVETGDYARAEPLLQRSLAIREKALGPEHLDVAQSLNNLADLYKVRGQLARAEPLFRRSLEIRERALGPEHPDVAEALNNLADLYRMRGEFMQAEPLFRRSLATYEKALGAEHPGVALSLNNLAALYVERGQLARAEALLRRSLAIYEKVLDPEHPDVALSLGNLAALYKEKGDYARAEPLLQRSLAIRERALGPEHPDVAVTLNNLALLYWGQEDYARAEALYRRSLAAYEKALGPEHPDVAKSLNNLATLYNDKAEFARAEPLYQRSLEIRERALGPEHPDVADSLNNLAALYQAKGELARAEPLYRRSLAAYEKVLGPEHPKVALSHSNLATLYEAKGDRASAVEFLSRAQEVRERNLSLVLFSGSERQKLAYLATLSYETSLTVSLHARSAPSDTQALMLSLTTILRRKGRALDAMSGQVASLRRRLDSQSRELLDRLSSAQTRLSHLVLGGPDETPANYDQSEVARLEAEVEQLQDAISRRSAEFGARARPVTVEGVRRAVPAGVALVEFYAYRPFDARARARAERFGPARYVAYVLKGGGEPLWAELGEAAAIDAEVSGLLAALKSPSSKNHKEAARALDERLMRPVRKLLGDTRQLFISPDGALNLVPFAALVDENGEHLAETYTLTYLTSGRDLLHLLTASESRQPPLILADPLFGGQRGGAAVGGEGAYRSSDMVQVFFPRLPGTAGEAKALSKALPGARVLTQAEATEAALKRVSAPRVLHVATHGFFLPGQQLGEAGNTLGAGNAARASARVENPLLRSGLALEGANNRHGANGEDGILTALEASALDLWGTRLVVLSACETGVGEVKNGEGVYGLRRALVLAGSESQVMSLWQVSDEATRDLMVGYYRRLQAGEGRSDALRRVQLEMLRGGGQTAGGPQRGIGDKLTKKADRSHPYFWAAFIQSGDWRPMAGQTKQAKSDGAK